MPEWLVVFSWISLALAGVSALIVLADILAGHRQHMGIMNIVWPVTALWSGPLGLWAYYRVGRLSTRHRVQEAREHGKPPPGKSKPFPLTVGVGATHCGAGCTLGDLCAEWLVVLAPAVLVWFGYRTLFDEKIFAGWVIDYLFAFGFGIAFQYFTIKPMRGLSVGKGLVAALQADTLSLSAWQVGMYGWMAIATFAIFGREIPKTGPVFWFMMQIAMLAGFLTSYPVNWWLVRRGIKEPM
jgi:hypothetical protein